MLILLKLHFQPVMIYKVLSVFFACAFIIGCTSKPVNGDSSQNIEGLSENSTQPAVLEEQIQEDDYLTIALKQLNIDRHDCNMEYIVEDVLPYDSEKSVIVIPIVADREGDFVIMDVHLAVIDHNTKKIVHWYYDKNALSSEGVWRLYDIKVDTTFYKLNPTTNAFGIQTSYVGSSQPNPSSSSSVSLFVPQGEKLIKVLGSYCIYDFSGETDTMCNGDFETEKVILSVSEEQTNGYNDIIADKTFQKTQRNVDDENDCIETILEEKTEKEILRFSNGEYQFKRKGPEENN